MPADTVLAARAARTVAETHASNPRRVPVWALRPGDTVRLPFHFPPAVNIEGSTCAGVACEAGRRAAA